MCDRTEKQAHITAESQLSTIAKPTGVTARSSTVNLCVPQTGQVQSVHALGSCALMLAPSTTERNVVQNQRCDCIEKEVHITAEFTTKQYTGPILQV